MTTRSALHPRAIADGFAEMIRGESEVQSLHYTTDAGVTTFWLRVVPMAVERERSFFAEWARYAADHPDVVTRLHVINPRFYDEASVSDQLVPADARPVSLQG